VTIEAEVHADAHQGNRGRLRRVCDVAMADRTRDTGDRGVTPVRVVDVIGQAKQLAEHVVLSTGGQGLDFLFLGIVGQRLLVTAPAGGERRQPRMLARLVILVAFRAVNLQLLDVLLMVESDRLHDRARGA